MEEGTFRYGGEEEWGFCHLSVRFLIEPPFWYITDGIPIWYITDGIPIDYLAASCASLEVEKHQAWAAFFL